MYNEEKEPMYLLHGKNLETILRRVVRDEMATLERKLKRESKVLTREDAAEKIGVCPNTISEYVKTGRLPNRGIGRKILILESDLEGIKPNRYTHYTKAS